MNGFANRVLNVALSYVGWFACVVGAARGEGWLGPVVVTVLLAVHLWLTPDRPGQMRLILAVGVFGFLVDSVQTAAGVYAFPHASVVPWLCPPWLVALWMLFATTLDGSMAWLGGRYGLAAALGAVIGPLSYGAGARLGAIVLPADPLASLMAMSAVWALALPALLWMRDVASLRRAWVRA
jgi:hypothetical protein